MAAETTLNYLANPDENPVVYNYAVPEAERAAGPRYERHAVAIGNARELPAHPTLAGQGFELVEQQSSVANFYDDATVREVYYSEVEELVARQTGARRVLAFDHNVRCRSRSQQDHSGIQGPIKAAHNDYTARSAAHRVRDLIDADEAEVWLSGRFGVINVWRSIQGEIESHPLAVCDATSIREEDMVSVPLLYPDREGVVQIMSFDPEQRWYYYPQMRQDEVLLLECFASAAKGRAHCTGHSAFDDPSTAEGARERESIEVRTLVFY